MRRMREQLPRFGDRQQFLCFSREAFSFPDYPQHKEGYAHIS